MIKATVLRIQETELLLYCNPHCPMSHHIPSVLSPHISGEGQIIIPCVTHYLHVVLGGQICPQIHHTQDWSATSYCRFRNSWHT